MTRSRRRSRRSRNRTTCSTGQLTEVLKARGIDRSALVDQLNASIVWAKLVRRQASQTVDVSDEEIDEAVKRARETREGAAKPGRRNLSAVDNPAQDEEVRRLAERLIEQMRQGARFSAVARQFSQVGDAPRRRRHGLGAARAAAARARQGGGAAAARRTVGADPYRRRAITCCWFSTAGSAGASGQRSRKPATTWSRSSFRCRRRPTRRRGGPPIAEADSVREPPPRIVRALLKIGKEKAPQLSSEGQAAEPADLPQMRNIVIELDCRSAGVAADRPKERGRRDHGLRKGGARRRRATREEIAETLMRQRLDTVSRRYLRDLRRNAYVDVRV